MQPSAGSKFSPSCFIISNIGMKKLALNLSHPSCQLSEQMSSATAARTDYRVEERVAPNAHRVLHEMCHSKWTQSTWCSVRPSPFTYGVPPPYTEGWTHTAFLNTMESKAIRLIESSPLADCLEHRSPLQSCIFTFSSYFLGSLLNLLTTFTQTSPLSVPCCSAWLLLLFCSHSNAIVYCCFNLFILSSRQLKLSSPCFSIFFYDFNRFNRQFKLNRSSLLIF